MQGESDGYVRFGCSEDVEEVLAATAANPEALIIGGEAAAVEAVRGEAEAEYMLHVSGRSAGRGCSCVAPGARRAAGGCCLPPQRGTPRGPTPPPRVVHLPQVQDVRARRGTQLRQQGAAQRRPQQGRGGAGRGRRSTRGGEGPGARTWE